MHVDAEVIFELHVSAFERTLAFGIEEFGERRAQTKERIQLRFAASPRDKHNRLTRLATVPRPLAG